MNPQHVALQFSLFANGDNLTLRLAGRAEHRSGFISFGAKGTRMGRGTHAENLLRFVERCLLGLVFVMDGQNPGHACCILDRSIGHEAGKEAA